MTYKKLIRFLRGSVTFSVSGESREEFLSLAPEMGVRLYDIYKKDGVLLASVDRGDYKKLIPVRRITHCKIKLQKRFGVTFRFRPYRRRMGLIWGSVLLLAFFVIIQQFVWIIRINGNETLSDEYVLDNLGRLGLKVGVLTNSLDFDTIRQNALKELDSLSFLAINHQGSVVTVELKESIRKPDIIDETVPCNLIASKGGIIEELEVYDGKAMVKKGDGVAEGDLLISGALEGKRGHLVLQHARGVVLARTTTPITFSLPKTELVPKYAKNPENLYRLNLFSLKIPLYLPLPKDKLFESEEECFSFAPLPFSLCKTTIKEVTYTEMEISETVAAYTLKDICEKEVANCFTDGKVLEVKTRFEVLGDSYKLHAEIVCLQDIVKKKEISTNS